MKSTRRVILAFAARAGRERRRGCAGTRPQAPPPGPAYVLTYLEFAPSSVNNAIAAMKTYRDASRRETGARTRRHLPGSGSSAPLRPARDLATTAPRYDRHAMAASTTPVQHRGPADPFRADLCLRAHRVLDVAGETGRRERCVRGQPHRCRRDERAAAEGDAGSRSGLRASTMRVSCATRSWTRFPRIPIISASSSSGRAKRIGPRTTHRRMRGQFRDSVTPILGTPYDQRLYRLVN